MRLQKLLFWNSWQKAQGVAQVWPMYIIRLWCVHNVRWLKDQKSAGFWLFCFASMFLQRLFTRSVCHVLMVGWVGWQATFFVGLVKDQNKTAWMRTRTSAASAPSINIECHSLMEWLSIGFGRGMGWRLGHGFRRSWRSVWRDLVAIWSSWPIQQCLQCGHILGRSPNLLVKKKGIFLHNYIKSKLTKKNN